MRQKGGVDSPFRSPTRAFFVRFPSIPPRIHPYPFRVVVADRGDERSVQHNARNQRQMCALRSMHATLSLSLSLFFSPLFHSASPHRYPDTPSLFFRARYGNSTFIPPPLSVSLSLSRLCNIFNVHELAGSRYH